MGACDQKTTESILDYFYEQGGNFVDTANNVSVTFTCHGSPSFMSAILLRSVAGLMPPSVPISTVRAVDWRVDEEAWKQR